MNPVLNLHSFRQFILACFALLPSVTFAGFARDSLAIANSQKVTVSRNEYPGMVSPNPRGWYHHSTNVVVAKDGSLVGCYRLSDSHTSLATWIMIARSTDGGRTWKDHKAIARAMSGWNSRCGLRHRCPCFAMVGS